MKIDYNSTFPSLNQIIEAVANIYDNQEYSFRKQLIYLLGNERIIDCDK